MEFLRLIQSPNFQWVLIGTLLLGVSSGVLGSFTLLRRQSLMGDVLAHTALPGICLAFMLTSSKSIAFLLAGAVLTGLVGSWAVNAIVRLSRIKQDTAQGLILTVFFAMGIVLLTHIARSGAADQSGLDRFLFGQAASLVVADVYIIGGVALALCLVAAVLFKEFKLLCFDPAFGRGLGFPMRRLDDLLMLLVVCAVAIGLQAVGVVLMAAMLITPAIAARYWTNDLSRMVWIAGAMGGLSSVFGTAASTIAPGLSTGPLIVLFATVAFLASLSFAPSRGLIPNALRRLRVRKRVAREKVLRAIFEACEADTPSGERVNDRAIAVDELALRHNWSRFWLNKRLQALQAVGWVELVDGRCRLTTSGWKGAYDVVRRHRLWEAFLMNEGRLPTAHVDRDEGELERYLPPESVGELERLLESEGRFPTVPKGVQT